MSVSKIAKELNRNKSSISSVVKRFNLHPVKEYVNTINHCYFDVIDRPIKAYLLGFFIADGCIYTDDKSRSRYRLGITISSIDRVILEVFKSELNCPTEIKSIINTKGAINRQEESVLRWTSKHMIETLSTKYHIIQRKTYDYSYKFPFDAIDTIYYGDLIRGFIDGDGSFESHKGSFNPSIVGTSKEWLFQIGDIVRVNTDLDYHLYEHQGKTCKYYSLRWYANRINKVDKVKKFYDFLYHNEYKSIDRKRIKMINYLKYRANQVQVNGIWKCNA